MLRAVLPSHHGRRLVLRMDMRPALAIDEQIVATKADVIQETTQVRSGGQNVAALETTGDRASSGVMTMNFISREEVLAILDRHRAADIRREVETLFSFPAPNPDWKHGDRNVMGQTEDEFWAGVDAQDK